MDEAIWTELQKDVYSWTVGILHNRKLIDGAENRYGKFRENPAVSVGVRKNVRYLSQSTFAGLRVIAEDKIHNFMSRIDAAKRSGRGAKG